MEDTNKGLDTAFSGSPAAGPNGDDTILHTVFFFKQRTGAYISGLQGALPEQRAEN